MGLKSVAIGSPGAALRVSQTARLKLALALIKSSAYRGVAIPLALLALGQATGAYAEDKVVAAGANSGSVELSTGDSLTNSGTITSNGQPAVGSSTGGITFILNTATGVITATGDIGVGINGTVGTFNNAGAISSTNSSAFGAAGRVGSFSNSGTLTSATQDATVYFNDGVDGFSNAGLISNTGTDNGVSVGQGTIGTFSNSGTISAQDNNAVGFGGVVQTFTNTGTLSGGGYQVVYFEKGVVNFVNGASGTIRNTNNNGRSGDGVGFNTDLAAGGAVTNFSNYGTIQGDLTAPDSNGVGFYDDSQTTPTAFQTERFFNAGVIEGTGNGVFSRGGFGTFENAGTIIGGTRSGVATDGIVGTFTNTGKIVSTVDSAVRLSERVGSFTNSNLISGGSYGAVSLEKGVGTFLNAAGGVIRNTGSGGDSGDGVNINTDLNEGGVVNSFTNNGTITGDMTAAESSGVTFYDKSNNDPNAFQIGSFANSGSIQGSGSGVQARGGFGTFENTGTIIGGIYAGVNIDSDVGKFTNSGKISSVSSNALRFGAAVGSFSNSGQLTAGGGDGIEFNGAVGSFTNTNSIVAPGNGVRFDGTVASALNSGTIKSTATSGEAGVSFSADGSTLTNTGTIQGPTGVRFGGQGANVLTNSGKIVGTDGRAVAFDGGDDKLVLQTGSAITGAINFEQGNDTLDFAGYAGNSVLKVYDVENIVAGDRLYFVDQPKDEIAIVEKYGVAGTASASTTAIVNQIQTSLTNALNNAGGGDSESAVLGYAAAPIQGDAEIAIEDAQTQPDRAIWGTLIGGGSLDASPVNLATVFGGVVAGTHAQFAPGTTLGILGSAAASSTSVNNGGQTVRTSVGLAGLYGRTEAGVVNLNYSVLAGVAGHQSNRQIVGSPDATASFTSWFIAPTVGVELPVFQSGDNELSVVANVGYVGGNVSGYTEAGSIMNLVVGQQAINLLDARFGLSGEHHLDSNTKLTANAGVSAQSNFGGTTVPVTYAGQTLNATLPGTTEWGVYGGIGVNSKLSSNLTLTGNVDGQLRFDGLQSIAASAGLKGSF